MNIRILATLLSFALLVSTVPARAVPPNRVGANPLDLTSATAKGRAYELTMMRIFEIRKQITGLFQGVDYLEREANALLYPRLTKGEQPYAERKKRSDETRALAQQRRSEAAALQRRLNALVFLERKRVQRAMHKTP